MLLVKNPAGRFVCALLALTPSDGIESVLDHSLGVVWELEMKDLYKGQLRELVVGDDGLEGFHVTGSDELDFLAVESRVACSIGADVGRRTV